MAEEKNVGQLATAEEAKRNTAPAFNGVFDFNGASTEDAFWEYTDIDATRWNKSFPFQLLVVKKDGLKYTEDKNWRFTLPIPPSDLSISTPFAISTTVTLGGIVEEHNGAPIRNISFSGTTGVLPLRGSQLVPKQTKGIESIFGGTVNAIKTAVKSASQALGLSAEAQTNLVPESEFANDGDAGKGTGYYQFRLLQVFLESYVTIKKTGAGRDLRLALALWKDQAVYLVTPASFDVRRSASSPWEYNYSLNFRAFKRVNIGRAGEELPLFKPLAKDPSKFASVLNQIQKARRALQAVKGVIQAVRGDVDALVFEPLREVTLFCKDALGIAVAAADLPKNIISDMKGAVLEASSLKDAPGGIAQAFSNAGASIASDIQDLSVITSKSETGAGELPGSSGGALSGAHTGNSPFDNPDDNFELFAEIKPSELNLPPSVQRKINDEKERVRRFTRLDFEHVRDVFVEFIADYADAIGAGDETYNEIYGRPSKVVDRVPTPDDHEALFALNQIVVAMNKLAVSNTIDRHRTTTIDQMAGMASRSGIAFKTPTSKFAVPFPYMHTLEQVSARYLGTPDRWHELVALNGLRTPFVDEEGFDLLLLTNGRGLEVIVPDASQLFVGQQVWLSSTNTSRTKRHITNIDRSDLLAVVLTLDGEDPLDIYTTMAQATLHAFLPDTVNSQMLIYIPSDKPSTDSDFATKSIPGVDELDPLIQVGGVDLLLTHSGDLAVTSDGDCRLAIGLTNIIQKVRVALSTPAGSLLHHPEFGLEIPVGSSTADLNSADLLQRAKNLFKGDPAFTGVTGASVVKSGPLVKMTIAVGVAGANQVIPISIDVKQ